MLCKHIYYKTKHRERTFSSLFNVDSTAAHQKASNMLENPQSLALKARKNNFHVRTDRSAEFGMF